MCRELRQKHIQLIKDRRHQESKLRELEEKSNQMMMLKFGRIVDLDMLETVGVNRNVIELRNKLRLNEQQCEREMCKYDVRFVNNSRLWLLF